MFGKITQFSRAAAHVVRHIADECNAVFTGVRPEKQMQARFEDVLKRYKSLPVCNAKPDAEIRYIQDYANTYYLRDLSKALTDYAQERRWKDLVVVTSNAWIGTYITLGNSRNYHPVEAEIDPELYQLGQAALPKSKAPAHRAPAFAV